MYAVADLNLRSVDQLLRGPATPPQQQVEHDSTYRTLLHDVLYSHARLYHKPTHQKAQDERAKYGLFCVDV